MCEHNGGGIGDDRQPEDLARMDKKRIERPGRNKVVALDPAARVEQQHGEALALGIEVGIRRNVHPPIFRDPVGRVAQVEAVGRGALPQRHHLVFVGLAGECEGCNEGLLCEQTESARGFISRNSRALRTLRNVSEELEEELLSKLDWKSLQVPDTATTLQPDSKTVRGWIAIPKKAVIFWMLGRPCFPRQATAPLTITRSGLFKKWPHCNSRPQRSLTKARQGLQECRREGGGAWYSGSLGYFGVKVEAVGREGNGAGRQRSRNAERSRTAYLLRGQEPSLAVFRGVVFQGKAKAGKSWRRGGGT